MNIKKQGLESTVTQGKEKLGKFQINDELFIG